MIYSIPLDSARTDAAPHRHSVAIGGGSSGGTGGSGGSAAGGGHAPTRSGGTPPGNGKSAVLVPGGQPGSLIHSSNGFGSSSQVPGLRAPSLAGLGAVQSKGSSAPALAYALAAITLLAGLGIGSRSRWTSLRHSMRPDDDQR